VFGRLRSLFATSIAALLPVVLIAPYAGEEAAAAPAARADALTVEGCVAGWGGGAKAYLSDRRVVDLVGVDGVELSKSADGITRVLDPARKALRVVHRQHDRAELLLSNYSDAIDDFDPALAHRLLTSARQPCRGGRPRTR
jgi:hypothetical protein